MCCMRNAPDRPQASLGPNAAVFFLFMLLLGLFSLNIKPKFPIRRTAQPVGATPANRLATTYGKLPLSFEANQGQTDRAVKYD